MANDYIDRKALLKHLTDVAYHHLHSDVWSNRLVGASFMNLSETVERIPAADVVEVVRCKDCRHRDPEDNKCDCGQLERAGCVFPVDDNYWCAHGEKGANE